MYTPASRGSEIEFHTERNVRILGVAIVADAGTDAGSGSVVYSGTAPHTVVVVVARSVATVVARIHRGSGTGGQRGLTGWRRSGGREWQQRQDCCGGRQRRRRCW
jgi:hypothetical protein